MLIVSPVVLLSAAVTLLAALLYIYMGINVSRVRTRHSLQPPAMTGHPEVERAIRVQSNTLEHLPVFYAALWIAAVWFHPASILGAAWATPALGLVWIIGRMLYMQGYMRAPEKRELGFVVAMLAQLLLIILGFIGIITTWMVVTTPPA